MFYNNTSCSAIWFSLKNSPKSLISLVWDFLDFSYLHYLFYGYKVRIILKRFMVTLLSFDPLVGI
jgi:hypothetical protein